MYSSLQHLLQESLVTFRLRICWFHSQYEPKNKFCHEIVHPKTGPIFVFPRIHPLTWDDSSLRSKIYSRHDPFISLSASSSRVMKNCPFSIFFEKPALEQSVGQFFFFKKICEFLLIFTQQVFLYFGISLRSLICCQHFWWHYHGFQVLKRYAGDFPAHEPTTAPWTLDWLTEIFVRRISSMVSSLPLKWMFFIPSPFFSIFIFLKRWLHGL